MFLSINFTYSITCLPLCRPNIVALIVELWIIDEFHIQSNLKYKYHIIPVPIKQNHVKYHSHVERPGNENAGEIVDYGQYMGYINYQVWRHSIVTQGILQCIFTCRVQLVFASHFTFFTGFLLLWHILLQLEPSISENKYK